MKDLDATTEETAEVRTAIRCVVLWLFELTSGRFVGLFSAAVRGLTNGGARGLVGGVCPRPETAAEPRETPRAAKGEARV